MTQKMTEPLNGDEKRSLMSLCLIVAKEQGFVMADVSDVHNDRVLQLYREWGGDGWAKNFKIAGDKFRVEDAAANFKGWCQQKQGEFARRLAVREIKITEMTVTLVVPQGGGYVEFGIKGTPPDAPDKEEIMEMFGVMLSKAIIGFEELILHPATYPTRKKFMGKDGEVKDTFEFTSIRTTSEAGKRSFFVKGGPYVKYGVRVFPNVLSAAGIDPESISGEKFISGIAVFTKKANGDPDLVVGITLGKETL